MESAPTDEKLESQFILRLPQKQAETVKKYLKTKPKKIKKHVKITLDPETRDAEVTVKKTTIPMKLVDLPTIVESLKTTNSKVFFKTADICQMLVPNEIENNNNVATKEEKKHLWPHGITPPLKNTRKSRFRRTLKNTQALDEPEIEKEVKWLLKMDHEAVSVRWELVDDDKNDSSKIKLEDDFGIEAEREMFGDIISDSDEEQFDSINSSLQELKTETQDELF